MLAKLVRDGVPDLIRGSGEVPVVKRAADGEFRLLLREKLAEEVGEFLDCPDPALSVLELVDVLEVVYAIADDLGVQRMDLEAARRAKAQARGDFSGRTVWWGNVG